MKIITNNQYRDLINGYQLSDTEKQDFDYIDDDEIGGHCFFKYKGFIYDPSEFMPTPHNEPARQELNELSAWDGYQSDSYFSGIVIKFDADYEQVKIGTYFS